MAASLVPQAVLQFCDSNGQPLVGGTVGFYVPNTTTLGTIWADAGQLTQLPNPIGLDAAGRPATAAGEVGIFGDAQYKMTVLDINGNNIWSGLTQDPLSQTTGLLTNPVLVGTVTFKP